MGFNFSGTQGLDPDWARRLQFLRMTFSEHPKCQAGPFWIKTLPMRRLGRSLKRAPEPGKPAGRPRVQVLYTFAQPLCIED